MTGASAGPADSDTGPTVVTPPHDRTRWSRWNVRRRRPADQGVSMKHRPTPMTTTTCTTIAGAPAKHTPARGFPFCHGAFRTLPLGTLRPPGNRVNPRHVLVRGFASGAVSHVGSVGECHDRFVALQNMLEIYAKSHGFRHLRRIDQGPIRSIGYIGSGSAPIRVSGRTLFVAAATFPPGPGPLRIARQTPGQDPHPAIRRRLPDPANRR